jgi:hypothetical protein
LTHRGERSCPARKRRPGRAWAPVEEGNHRNGCDAADRRGAPRRFVRAVQKKPARRLLTRVGAAALHRRAENKMLETTSPGSTTMAVPSARSRFDGVCSSVPGLLWRQQRTRNESAAGACGAASQNGREQPRSAAPSAPENELESEANGYGSANRGGVSRDSSRYARRSNCGVLTLAADSCVRTAPVGGEPREKALRVNGLRFKLCGIVATFVKTTISLCKP